MLFLRATNCLIFRHRAKFFLVLLVSAVLFSCQKKAEEANEKVNSFINSVQASNNPNDSDLLLQVNHAFQKYKETKQYDSCVHLLIAYGVSLYNNSSGNATFKANALDYFEHLEKDKEDYTHFALSNLLASNYSWEGNTDSALVWLHEGQNAMDDLKSQRAHGFACSEMGVIYLVQSKLDSSEHYFLKAIQTFEHIKDSFNLTVNYINLSTIFQSLHAWDLAETYLDQAYNLAKNSDDSDLKLGILHIRALLKNDGFADTTAFLRLIDEAKTIYNNSASPSLYVQLSYHSMLFEEAILLHKTQEAKKELEYCDSINLIMANAGIQEQITYMQTILSNADETIILDEQLAKNTAQSFEKQNAYTVASRIYMALASSSLAKNDFKSALEYKTSYYRSEDSLTTHNQKGQLIELEKKYKTEQKEKQIAIQNVEIERSKFQITSLLLSLIGLALGVLIFFGYKKRKEAKASILRQQKFTDELLQNTEDERKRIATDLHDSVNHELLTLKNKATIGKEISSLEIEKVINDVRNVSRDLYPAMFDNIGLAASVEALCERMTEAGLFTSCEINYTLKLSKRNELQLYRIIQEALNNTLKHAKADASKVTIETVGNELQVEIKDNGIGFDTAEKMNNASSFGIQSLIQRARAMGGKSTIESNKNGTKLILKTPIH